MTKSFNLLPAVAEQLSITLQLLNDLSNAQFRQLIRS